MGWQQDGAHGAAHRSSDRSLASSWPSRQAGRCMVIPPTLLSADGQPGESNHRSSRRPTRCIAMRCRPHRERALLPPTGSSGLSRRWHPRPSCTPHGPVILDGEAGHGAGERGSSGRDALMLPRLEDGLRDGRVPGDRGRSGGHQPGLIQRPGSGWRLGPRNAGAAARRDRTLPPSR